VPDTGFVGRQERRRVRVSGVVQGVGFRPFVHRLASELRLDGHVGNDTHGVFVEVEGLPQQLDDFTRRLTTDGPPLAMVESVDVQTIESLGTRGFVIVVSASNEGDGQSSSTVALVPPDTACCPSCWAETLDPEDRRYRYPFTACTYCGPRFTMVKGIPYDRPFTTMVGFPLCDACAAEYEDPADRRFHAQPTACPACGPRLSFVSSDLGPAQWRADRATGDDALAEALAVLHRGGIVAIKGVGGYHLACDARSPEVVGRLRDRKQRSGKPFAVMVRDLDAAGQLGQISPAERAVLSSPAAPIVLLDVVDSDQARTVARSVAPGQDRVGVLLAYSPLHRLLFEPHPQSVDASRWTPQVLVLTSANLADEPICTDPEEAELRLAGIADAWLHHDRPIHVACDDSVVQLDDATDRAEVQPIRRSRGYAPMPVRLPFTSAPALAVGGELKATVCAAVGPHAWLSQHLGDVASRETLASMGRATEVLLSLTRFTPEVVVADLHPRYLSRRWAQEYARDRGLGCLLVQHHHAHLASLLAEHGVAVGRPVIGFAFDGTGYGTDATIWGGEVLVGSYASVERVGHLKSVPLPGGDAAIRRPARVALSHLRAAGVGWEPAIPAVAATDDVERRVVAGMLRSGSGCVPTTSMGRLFDAVASILGVCHDAGYEGQAAIELEAVSRLVSDSGADPAGAPALVVDDDLVMDPGPLVARCVADLTAGVPVPQVGHAFHAAVARAVVTVAGRVRDSTGVDTVGLTGGVFQNRLLTMLTRASLESAGFTVLVHRTVPANDGGLALGQVAVAACGGAQEGV
jgi:hydrogenase maturation protein HypF